jgi:hypothetical protein
MEVLQLMFVNKTILNWSDRVNYDFAPNTNLISEKVGNGTGSLLHQP